MRVQIDLQTSVTFADKYTPQDFRDMKYNLDNMVVRQCVSVDPVTKITNVEVYTDDGFGNGTLLYKFPLT